jgi:hypothetical protein
MRYIVAQIVARIHDAWICLTYPHRDDVIVTRMSQTSTGSDVEDTGSRDYERKNNVLERKAESLSVLNEGLESILSNSDSAVSRSVFGAVILDLLQLQHEKHERSHEKQCEVHYAPKRVR